MTGAVKPSRVAGVDSIPVDWSEKRLGVLSYVRARLGWRGLTADEYVNEGYAFLSAFNIIDDKLDFSDLNYIDKFRYDESPEIKLKPKDILLVKDGAGIGKCARIDALPFEATSNGSLAVITANESIDYRYLHYYFIEDAFYQYVDVLKNGMGVPHLFQSDLRKVVVPLPPLPEQQAIATFLDDRCGQVDAIIADCLHQVEILRQYKKALITETVTKGLDKSAPMKDSGIDWIGTMPKHWEINKLRYLASMCSGATPSKDNLSYWDGAIPWISSMEVKTDIIKDTSLHINLDAVRSCSTKLLPVGTVVMVVRSGILQHTLPVALTGVPATINQDVKAFFFKPCMAPAYFKYYVQGLNDYLLTALCKEKTTVENIDGNLLLGCPVPMPPIQEQEALIVYLDEQCNKVDELITEKQNAIEIMRQYKKSLIYEYVTGKKRVAH